MRIHWVNTCAVIKQSYATSPNIVDKRKSIWQMQLIHGFFGDGTEMHENAAQCILVTGNQDALALVDGFMGDALGVKWNLDTTNDVQYERQQSSHCLRSALPTYRTLHAVMQTFRFRELSMNLQLSLLYTSIQCFCQ